MRYRPSRFEGTPGEDAHPGSIELFLQPDDPSVIENADNITMAPWGDRLSETEIRAVANYLQTLYQPETGAGE